MPFHTFYAEVKPGRAKCVFTAAEGDQEITITTMPIPGQSQASAGYNFLVGGPELGENGGGGLYVMNSQWSSSLEAGDEVWVSVPSGELAWTEAGVPLTVLVRRKRSEDSGDGQNEDDSSQ